MSKYSLQHTIRQGLNGLFHICKEELKMTVRDQGVLIFFLLVPLAYPLVYAFIYTNEVVREVPAAVVDENKSAQSREYLRWVDGSPDIHIVSHCADMEEAKLLLKQQKVYGIIRIPEAFSSDLASGRQTRVSIYADMSGMLYYKALLLANTEASLKMNKEIQIQRAGNTTDRQDEIRLPVVPHGHQMGCAGPQGRSPGQTARGVPVGHIRTQGHRVASEHGCERHLRMDGA